MREALRSGGLRTHWQMRCQALRLYRGQRLFDIGDEVLGALDTA